MGISIAFKDLNSAWKKLKAEIQVVFKAELASIKAELAILKARLKGLFIRLKKAIKIH